MKHLRHFSELAATRRILGISKAEMCTAIGITESTLTTIEATKLGRDKCPRAIEKAKEFFEKCTNLLNDSQRSTFSSLVESLMEVDPTSLTNEGRIFEPTALRMALDIPAKEVAKKLKVSNWVISKIETNQVSKDEIRKKYEEYISSVYSSLTPEEQEKADGRASAIKIAKCPKNNPFRKLIVENGLLTTGDSEFRRNASMAIDEAIGNTDDTMESLKEFNKLLEEENDELREKIRQLEETISDDKREIEHYKKENNSISTLLDKYKKENSELNRILGVRCDAENANKNRIRDLEKRLELKDVQIDNLKKKLESMSSHDKPIVVKTVPNTTLETAKEETPKVTIEAIKEALPNIVCNNCTVIFNVKGE